MMNFVTVSDLLTAAIGLAALQFLVSLWLSERFKAALQRETGEFMEAVKWELKVREQSAKVAEYMSLARDLRQDSPPEDYRLANRLSWELALWLPADIYRSMTTAIANPNDETNPLSVLIKVRSLLLDEKSPLLGQDDIAHHAPGIGE